MLPQVIEKQPTKDITFCFRCVKPYKGVTLEILDGERKVKTVRKRYMLPAEMERILVKREELGTIENGLKVRVMEG